METALDTPRFGIVVSLSLLIPARAPLIHQRFHALSKDFGKEISSYGLLARVYVFRIRFIRRRRLDTFQEAGYFHLSELYETRSHFVLGHQANEILRFS